MNLKRYKGRRVIVILADSTIAGDLAESGRDQLVLERASVAVSDHPELRNVDGLAVVPVDSILWVQVP